MTKAWQPYAQHILDSIAKIRRIQARGDLMQDEVLCDATLRNLQTLSEATQQLPDQLKSRVPVDSLETDQRLSQHPGACRTG